MLILSLTFPSLVISEGEEEDNVDHNAKDAAATTNDDDDDNNDDNNNTTMPPKVKPVTVAASKTAKKKTKKADEIALLPAPKLPNFRTYSIEAEDPLTVSYFANGKHNYTDLVICVNRMMEYDEYEVRVAKDGCSILFVRAIHEKLFDNKPIGPSALIIV